MLLALASSPHQYLIRYIGLQERGHMSLVTALMATPCRAEYNTHAGHCWMEFCIYLVSFYAIHAQILYHTRAVWLSNPNLLMDVLPGQEAKCEPPSPLPKPTAGLGAAVEVRILPSSKSGADKGMHGFKRDSFAGTPKITQLWHDYFDNLGFDVMLAPSTPITARPINASEPYSEVNGRLEPTMVVSICPISRSQILLVLRV